MVHLRGQDPTTPIRRLLTHNGLNSSHATKVPRELINAVVKTTADSDQQ